MKNSDVFEYREALDAVNKIKGNSKFSYAVAKNMRILDNEIEAIRNGFTNLSDTDSESFNIYETSRLRLVGKYSSRADDSTVQDHAPFIEDMVGFQVELQELKEKHIDALTKARDVQIANTKVLDEEFVGELELFKIANEYLPDELDAQQIFVLDFMIA